VTPKVVRIIGWVLSGLLAAFLIVGSGVPKLLESSDPEMKKQMEEILTKIGWSAETIKVIGVIEIVIAVLYMVPRTGFLGAILLTGYLGGAIATHVRIGDAPVFPIVLGVLVWVALALRQPVLWRLAVGANPIPKPE
jgi:DoxX-like family